MILREQRQQEGISRDDKKSTGRKRTTVKATCTSSSKLLETRINGAIFLFPFLASITLSIKRITENIKIFNLASGFPSSRSSSVHLPIIFRFVRCFCVCCAFLTSLHISVKCETNVEAPALSFFPFSFFYSPINWPAIR